MTRNLVLNDLLIQWWDIKSINHGLLTVTAFAIFCCIHVRQSQNEHQLKCFQRKAEVNHEIQQLKSKMRDSQVNLLCCLLVDIKVIFFLSLFFYFFSQFGWIKSDPLAGFKFLSFKILTLSISWHIIISFHSSLVTVFNYYCFSILLIHLLLIFSFEIFPMSSTFLVSDP